MKANNEDYYYYIKGIADEPGVDFASLLQVNFVDETTVMTDFTGHGCTSLLVQMENGEVVHGRNLDYDPADALRALVHHVTFKDKPNGKVAYEAIMFAGIAAAQTAYKRGKFSISVNARYPGKQTKEIVDE